MGAVGRRESVPVQRKPVCQPFINGSPKGAVDYPLGSKSLKEGTGVTEREGKHKNRSVFQGQFGAEGAMEGGLVRIKSWMRTQKKKSGGQNKRDLRGFLSWKMSGEKGGLKTFEGRQEGKKEKRKHEGPRGALAR